MPSTLATLIKQASRALAFRSARIAATENSRAFNDEHGEAVVEVARSLTDEERRLFVNVWDATLDAAVCAVCAEHDGEIVMLGEDFEENEEPGEVHANCRCIEMAMKLAPPGLDNSADDTAIAEDLE